MDERCYWYGVVSYPKNKMIKYPLIRGAMTMSPSRFGTTKSSEGGTRKKPLKVRCEREKKFPLLDLSFKGLRVGAGQMLWTPLAGENQKRERTICPRGARQI